MTTFWTEALLTGMSGNILSTFASEYCYPAARTVGNIEKLRQFGIIGREYDSTPLNRTKKQRAELQNKRQYAALTNEQKTAKNLQRKLQKRDRREVVKAKEGGVSSKSSLKITDEEKMQADLDDYQSLLRLDSNHQDFAILTQRLKLREPSFLLLSNAQRQHFFSLLTQLHQFVETFVSAEEFHGSEKYRWNANIWLRALLLLSDFDKAGVHQLDWHVSNIRRDTQDRPIIKESGTNFHATVVVCTLFLGSPNYDANNKIFEASHACHNKKCTSPLHLLFESHADNVDRCKNGSYNTCYCNNKKCIWVRAGLYLPCRNCENDFVFECKCGRDCFASLKVVDADIMKV